MKINIKDFRQAQGLYQSQMAELLGLNQSNISRAEIKGYLELTYPMLQTLYEKYGQKEVDKFRIDDNVSVNASNNVNEGGGTQNNGYFHTDAESTEIIRRQAEAITMLAEKQAAQTERLIDLLEKLYEKL